MERRRCSWINESSNKLDINYHDYEWGVPVHNDRVLFEFLILEGAQAGLNWSTILRKRENYREAYDNFDFEKIAQYDEKKQQELLQNSGIIRNKLKIQSSITNAKAFLSVRKKYGSFDKYIWGFTNHTVLQNAWQDASEVPTSTKESKEMSQSLKNFGFKFVGPTICYAFMQAVGMVNDHTVDCYRHQEIARFC